MHKLLFFIFRVSYIAIKFESNKPGTFYRWSLVKGKLNLIINNAVFKFIGNIDYNPQGVADRYCKQFILDSIGEIVSQHYKRRVKFYKLCQKSPFNSKKVFLILSMLYAYYDEIVRLAFGIVNLRSQLNVEHGDLPDIIDLAIAFPKHGFTISSIEGSDALGKTTLSSFGEYLIATAPVTPNSFAFISVDEYSRRTKISQDASGKRSYVVEPDDVGEVDNIVEYPRTLTTAERGIFVFLSRFPDLVTSGFRSIGNIVGNLNYSLLEIVYLRKWTKSYRYKQFIDHLESIGKKVRHLYVFPFSNIGLLRYDEKVSPAIRNYNYSQNIIIPPAHYTYNIGDTILASGLDDILSDMSVKAFSFSGQAVGFTNIFTQINDTKKALNDRFNCKLPTEDIDQPPQRPVLLGYEVVQEKIDVGLSRCIAIFDVPPESIESQLSRALTGDRTCDYDVISQFLSDCFNACISIGFTVVFKPKYALSIYSANYQSIIEGFRSKFGNNFIVVSPYANMISLLRGAHGSISFPYTSTKSISQALGKPSVYFMPEMYRRSFPECANNQDLLFGENELSNYLKAILDQ